MSAANQLGAAVLDALGIDPAKVAAFDLRFRAGEPPTLLVRNIVTDGAGFDDIFSKYTVVER